MGLAESVPGPWRGTPNGALVVPAIVAVLYALAAIFANRPKKLAALWRRALDSKIDLRPAATRAAWTAIAWGVAWNVALVPLGRGIAAPRVFAFVVLGAFLLDAIIEVAARGKGELVAIVPEQRPYALPVARDVLAREGIEIHARSLRTRSLLSFFGPFVPIEISVEKKDAARAQALLSALLVDALPSRSRDKPRERKLPKRARLAGEPGPPLLPWRDPRVAGLAAIGVLGLGTAVLAARARDEAPAHAHAMRAKTPGSLALVEVDDSQSASDAMVGLKRALPAATRVEDEFVGGPGRSEARHFVRAWPDEGESVVAARARFEGWIHATPTPTLPDGDHIAIGSYDRPTLNGDERETNLRSYVLHGEPIATEANVEDAEVTTSSVDGRKHALVLVRFDAQGAAALEAWTASHIDRRLAIVSLGDVISAPVVTSRIPGGAMSITMGSESLDVQLAHAREIAAALGAAP